MRCKVQCHKVAHGAARGTTDFNRAATRHRQKLGVCSSANGARALHRTPQKEQWLWLPVAVCG
jgi:hypothetical protein